MVRPLMPPALSPRRAWSAAGVSAAALGAATLEARRPVAAGARPAALTPNADFVRGAASRLTTPLLPDDYLHLLNPLWSARELRGKVVEVVPETANAATLVIKPGWGFSFDYRAGQYVGIGTQVGGRWHWRSYSLTSAPKKNQGTIAITVKAMPEGFLSRHLVNGLAPGTVIRLAAPRGDFTLPEPPPAALLFLTAGSGITPVMAMLRTLDRRGTLPDVTLVHSAPTVGDVLFRAELGALVQAHPSLRMHTQLTDEMGVLSLDRLAEVCPDWTARQTWACGPPGMLDAAEKLWRARGIPGQLHMERFSVELSGAGGAGGTVTFARSGRDVVADGATTLLDAGESGGVQMPFGCRMGICQTCVVPLLAGDVRDLRSGTEHAVGDRIQTCISAAAGDCTLDL